MLGLLWLDEAAGAPGTSVTPAPVQIVIGDGVALGGARTRPGTFPNPEDAPGYVVKVVDRRGNVIQELPHANPKTIVWTLNEAEELTLDAPKYLPETAAIQPLRREVQVYRNDDLKFWGPVIDDATSSDAGAVSFPARGPWWIFSRRYFGSANRRNMIRNASFEQGPAAGIPGRAIPGWSQIGAQATHYSTTSRPALPAPLLGSKAVAYDEPAGRNAYLRNRWSYRTDFPSGQRVTAAAWVYILEWDGPAALGLGLYLGRVVAGQTIRTAAAGIDDDTPRGEWTRLETSLIVPPGQDGLLEVRLYVPGGVIVWDATRSVLMESTGAGSIPTDQAELAGTIVRYGQNGRGKSSVNVGTRTPATGVLRLRSWQHADHEWLNNAVDGLRSLPDGFDHSVELTPRTRTFVTHYPRKGTDRRGTLTLRFGPGGNVAWYNRPRSGGAVATSVVSRAAGDGPDREEGLAQDASALDGLILEDLVDAPDDLPIDELDDFAADELAARRDLVEVLELRLHQGSGDLIDVLETGDLVDVEIDDGYTQVAGGYRLVRIVLDCVADTLTVTANRWED